MLLTCFSINTYSQYSQDTTILYSKLRSTHDPREKFYLNFELVFNVYYHSGNVSNIKVICDSMMEIADKLGSERKEYKARTYLLYNLYWGVSGNYDSAIKYLYAALDIYKHSEKYSFEISTVYKEIGRVYKDLNCNDEALNMFRNAVKQMNGLPRLTFKQDSYNYMQPNRICYSIAEVYSEVGKKDSAAIFAEKLNELTDSTNDPYGYARLLITQGEIYADDNRFRQCIDFCGHHHLLFPLSIACQKYADKLFHSGSYDSAIFYAHQGLVSSTEINNTLRRIQLATLLEKCYITKNKTTLKLNDSISRYASLVQSLNDCSAFDLKQKKAFGQLISDDIDDKEEKSENEEFKNNMLFCFGVLSIISLLYLAAKKYIGAFKKMWTLPVWAVYIVLNIILVSGYEAFNTLLHLYFHKVVTLLGGGTGWLLLVIIVIGNGIVFLFDKFKEHELASLEQDDSKKALNMKTHLSNRYEVHK